MPITLFPSKLFSRFRSNFKCFKDQKLCVQKGSFHTAENRITDLVITNQRDFYRQNNYKFLGQVGFWSKFSVFKETFLEKSTIYISVSKQNELPGKLRPNQHREAKRHNLLNEELLPHLLLKRSQIYKSDVLNSCSMKFKKGDTFIVYESQTNRNSCLLIFSSHNQK